MKQIQVQNDNGIPIVVKVVQKGDAYGLDDGLVWEKDEPLIEFYDGQYIKGKAKQGQYIASYYLSTIEDLVGGLNLHAGVDGWEVSNENIEEIKQFLKDNGFSK